MGRTPLNTVDYFPHIAKPGKTLYILEGQFGNDGYAFWFKILEILSSSEGHFYDVSQEVEWNYFLARTRVSAQSATEMILLLTKLGNLDMELWSRKVLWCQALVDNLGEVYRKRKRPLPHKPICDSNVNICDRNRISATEIRAVDGISATEIPQSKVEYSKEEKRKRKYIKEKTSIPENFTISDVVRIWAEKKGFDRLEDHLESFKDRAVMKGYQYIDWDAAFKTAIREDWGKIRQNLPAGPSRQEPKGFDALRESSRRRRSVE
jgi:hypothetical protein